MTRPFCSKGVGTSRRTTEVSGRVATTLESASCLEARSERSRTRVATASRAGRNWGKTKPPEVFAAKRTRGESAASSNCVADSLVHSTSELVAAHIASTWRLASTGTAITPSGSALVTSRVSASMASWSSSTWPVSSTRVSCSPSGSNIAPRLAPEDRTSSASRAACTVLSKLMTPDVETFGLIPRTSAPSLASTLGMTKLVVPKE